MTSPFSEWTFQELGKINEGLFRPRLVPLADDSEAVDFPLEHYTALEQLRAAKRTMEGLVNTALENNQRLDADQYATIKGDIDCALRRFNQMEGEDG